MGKTLKLFPVRQIRDLRDMVSQSARVYGDLDAFLVKDNKTGVIRHISFQRFRDDIACLGSALCDLGLKDGRIAILSENRYEWCVSYLSTVNGTGVVVPIDKELPQNELINLLERSETSAVLCSGEFCDMLVELKQSLPCLKHIICFDKEESCKDILPYDQLLQNGKILIESGKRDFLDAVVDPEAMNMLIFTSGTTEQSKGVMLCHKNLVNDIMEVSRTLYADNKDLIMSILPLHHTYECTAGFLTMVYLGVRICFCEGLRHINKNLQEYKPSMMMSVPLILENVYTKVIKKAQKENRLSKLKFGIFAARALMKVKIDVRRKLFKEVLDNLGGNLRLVISGAAALNPKVAKALRAMGLNIMQGYGLTECSPIVSVNRLDDYRDASAGLPLGGIEVFVDNPGPDGIGEIKIRGPIVMLGYYKNPEATKAVLHDGWLYTGDNGYIDKNGFIYISGRKKNVIVTKNGKNIFPEDVELYLNKSEYIKESLVYGVDEDSEEDTLVCAKIVPNVEVLTEKFGHAPTRDELYGMMKQEVLRANKKLSSYKKIKHFEICEDEFTKTTTKKIKRQAELVSLKALGEMIKVIAKGENKKAN